MPDHFTVALAGNPNAGKSTIFNALTGSHQHIGNWPGKTVEKKEGRTRIGDREIAFIDLPGAYSLTAYSAEEIITRDFIVDERPNAVVAVVDATNLERNLYMVLQLLELGAPVIVAVNMIDVASTRGIDINLDALSKALGGTPVVATAARRGEGLEKLGETILTASRTRRLDLQQPVLRYSDEIEGEISRLEALLENTSVITRYAPRWVAIKLLEGETDLLAQLDTERALQVKTTVAQSAALIAAANEDEDAETLIVDQRYGFINAITRQIIARPTESIITPSEKIDRVLTHRVLGLPIFLLLMWIVFQLVANVSGPLLDWVDSVINGPIARWAVALLNMTGLSGTWFESLIVDGIIAGVGGMMVFVPVLFFLYLAIALLEDSGYMARAAFVMDRFMNLLGLHGKSFLPLLVGFGCNVPAIYATRTLENDDDRKLTAFLTTFMSCGARLPVYVIFGAAFFGMYSGHLIFAMYILGIVVAILTGFALKLTLFKNKPTPPFVMELPPYRLPTLQSVWIHIRERTLKFIKGVTTTIMVSSIVVWILLAIPTTADGQFNQVEPAHSMFGEVSRIIAPAFRPAGFESWEATGALVSGLVAKEVVVSTLNQVFVGSVDAVETPVQEPTTLLQDLTGIVTGFGKTLFLTGQEFVNIVPRTLNVIPGVSIPEADLLTQDDTSGDGAYSELENALKTAFSPLAAVAFNVFVLLYVPCMSTIAAMRQEFGLRWTIFQAGYALFVAWGMAVLVYQGGVLLGLG